MRTSAHQSEVACLRAQIDAEYQAAYNGLHGLSMGSSRHDFIQRRMERVAELGEQLIERLGKEEAIALIVAAMEGSSERPQEPGEPSSIQGGR